MIRVAYDHSIFAMLKFGGIPRYFSELASRIASQGEFKVRMVAPLYINHYLRSLKANMVAGIYIPQIPKFGRISKLISGVLAHGKLTLNSPDIVHETYYARRGVGPSGIKRVTTVFDMIHEKFPQCFSPRDRIEVPRAKVAAIKRAAHVICISESTKRDLLSILDIEPSRISVVPLATSMVASSSFENVRSKTDPYLLHVGQRSGYKNFQNLMLAYARSKILFNQFKLICFGGGPFSAGERAQFKELGIKDTMIEQVSGDDAVLTKLYCQASVFVFASRYEGFGIPLLEAMSCGCAVACSNTSSFPEVAGDAARYFDPDDEESIRFALEKLVNSESELKTLVKLGKERLQRFSWDKCASETAKIYRSLANNSIRP